MLAKPLVGLTLLGLLLSAACSSYGTAPEGAPFPLGMQRHPSGVRRAGGSASQYIKNVVVIIQENRSFEDFFAGYPGADAPTTGCASPTPSPGESVRIPTRRLSRPLNSSSPCPPGDTVVPLHEVTFETNPDLRHDWYSSMIDWNNGNMDGFTAFGGGDGLDAYGYVDHKELAPYYTMAQQYVLADQMFPTEFGGSFTAHVTLVAGTDDIKLPGQAEVDFPSAIPDDCDSPPQTKSSYITETPYRKIHLFQGPFPCFDQFNTIAEVLDNAGVSWKIYATQVLDAGLWEPFEAMKYVRYGPDWYSDIIAPQTRILTDPEKGELAQVSWVTPSHEDSDHPAYKSDRGPSWVASVVNSIGESKYWGQSAIVILWDDWGGSYDNAPPPQLDYRGLGIRVGCLIISPYAKQDYVSNVQYEFGSILRFIEEVNGLPAGSIGPVSLGYTDGRAASLDDAFDFSQSPRPFQPIQAKYPRSVFLHEKPSKIPVDYE